MNNLQIISGVLQLRSRQGEATVDFNRRQVDGQARLLEFRGPRNNFQGIPHAIVSPSDLSLSTRNNTSYRISRSPRFDSLNVSWSIDGAGGRLEIDFMVIGEAA